MDIRVQDLIEDYMKDYGVVFNQAISLMIEDLNDALKAGEKATLID